MTKQLSRVNASKFLFKERTKSARSAGTFLKKTKTEVLNPVETIRIDSVFKRIAKHIDLAQVRIVTTINTEMVHAYWMIGREIVEEEIGGKSRAKYGDALIKILSKKLTLKFGRGYTVRSLHKYREFYLTYKRGPGVTLGILADKNRKVPAVRALSQKPSKMREKWQLSWSHYRLLTTIDNPYRRSFYETESIKNRWSSRELERQIGSLLYDRLAKSKDKAGLMQLAINGQEIKKPEDVVKDPLVLEFLNIPESHRLIETDLEEALINNLQHFLLELGKGFAFIARQQRLTLNRNHYYCDLIFYHAILKCYILIDVKSGTLTHGDLGQMQLYVNYYDQECLTVGDNPTVGLILCAEKDDAMVKYTLGESQKRIFASRYQLYLPSEEELAAEIRKELKSLHRKTKKE